MSNKNTITTTIRNCARCRGTHDYSVFQPLVGDPVEGDQDYTHWAMCPATQQPILLAVVPPLTCVKCGGPTVLGMCSKCVGAMVGRAIDEAPAMPNVAEATVPFIRAKLDEARAKKVSEQLAGKFAKTERFLPGDYQSIEPKLAEVINKDSRENASDTPDFILARLMARCLRAFEQAVNERKEWYGHQSSCKSGEGENNENGEDLCESCADPSIKPQYTFIGTRPQIRPNKGSTTSRKFYRTVIQIEILSEEPYESTDLADIIYDITEGHCSGQVEDIVRNEEKNDKEMAALLIAQRSDPGFFQLDEDGNDTEGRENVIEPGCPNCDGTGRDTCPLCSGTNQPFPEGEEEE